MNRTILVLTNNIAGLYNFRKEVMKALVDKGYKVAISIPEDSDKAEFFREIGCEIILTEFNRRGTNPIADLKLLLTYRKMLIQKKPTAVLTYTIKPNIYGGIAARLCRVPQLANITGLGDAVENGGLLQNLTTWLYKFGVSRAYRIFFQNESNRNYCISKKIVGEDSILLPGSGVNLQHHVYQEYPANDGKIRFLFIGRLLRDKGAEEYLETAKVIRRKYPETEFQIIGSIEGDYQQMVDELVNAGIIRFLGRQFDVRPYIGTVECTIMPSYHEGMSNVNLESAANGRPVITTDVPGCRDTVDDGETGIIVKAKDSQSLINGVERFLSFSYEKKRQLGINARKKVEREFDRQIVVDAYLNAIEKL